MRSHPKSFCHLAKLTKTTTNTIYANNHTIEPGPSTSEWANANSSSIECCTKCTLQSELHFTWRLLWQWTHRGPRRGRGRGNMHTWCRHIWHNVGDNWNFDMFNLDFGFGDQRGHRFAQCRFARQIHNRLNQIRSKERCFLITKMLSSKSRGFDRPHNLPR